ncbi:unnamed protein product [Parajaminaea phylloscopi]
MPRSLDILILKAQSLFPVPPGHTPYITLEHDEHTELLEDALPFIREREVLVLRWTPETPRRSSGNRVRWHQSVTDAQAGTSSSGSSSPPSRQPVKPSANRTAPTTKVAALSRSLRIPPITSVATRGPEVRAAHAKRVLAEQQRLRDAEAASQVSDVKTCTEGTSDDPSICKSNDRNNTLPHELHAETEDCDVKQGRPPLSNSNTFNSLSAIVASDLEASGSSPPPYSSPEDNLSLAVKKAVASERSSTPECQRTDAVQLSSPLVASPTRNVHAAVFKAAMSPHDSSDDSILVAGRGSSMEAQNATPASSQPLPGAGGATEDVRQSEQPQVEAINSASGQIASPSKGEASPMAAVPTASPRLEAGPCPAEADLNHTVKVVMDRLYGHPSSHFYRTSDTRSASYWNEIRSRVDSKYYQGSVGLDRFQADLKDLWQRTRTSCGERSSVGQQVSALERFVSVLFSEMGSRIELPDSRESGSHSVSGRSGTGQADASREDRRRAAAALLASWNSKQMVTPAKRGEKRTMGPSATEIGAPLSAAVANASHKRVKSMPRPTEGRARTLKRSGADEPRKGPQDVDMTAFHRAMTGQDKETSAQAMVTIAPAQAPEQPTVDGSSMSVYGESVEDAMLSSRSENQPDDAVTDSDTPMQTNQSSAGEAADLASIDAQPAAPSSSCQPNVDDARLQEHEELSALPNTGDHDASQETDPHESFDLSSNSHPFRTGQTGSTTFTRSIAKEADTDAEETRSLTCAMTSPIDDSMHVRDVVAPVSEPCAPLNIGDAEDEERREAADVESGLLSSPTEKSIPRAALSIEADSPASLPSVSSGSEAQHEHEEASASVAAPKRGKRGKRGRGACPGTAVKAHPRKEASTDSVGPGSLDQEQENCESTTEPIAAVTPTRRRSRASAAKALPTPATRSSLRRRSAKEEPISPGHEVGASLLGSSDEPFAPALSPDCPAPTPLSDSVDLPAEPNVTSRRSRRSAVAKASVDCAPPSPAIRPSSSGGKLSSMAAAMMALLS